MLLKCDFYEYAKVDDGHERTLSQDLSPDKNTKKRVLVVNFFRIFFSKATLSNRRISTARAPSDDNFTILNKPEWIIYDVFFLEGAEIMETHEHKVM